MTDEERIKSIMSELEHDYISYDNLHGDNGQGMRLIEKALKQYLADRWVPVTERLPEEEKYCLVTHVNCSDKFAVDITKFVGRPACWRLWDVVAWRPLPEPYVDVKEKENKK